MAQKSKAIASQGVRQEVRDEISNIAPIPIVTSLGKYKGFPLHEAHTIQGCFNFPLENIQNKLASWKTNLPNMVGRVCLTKFVIAEIQTYFMQALWIPKGVLHRIERTMRSFIWYKMGV